MVVAYADEDQEFTVIATRPYPPVNARQSQVRDQQLQAVGELAAETAGPLLVMGDLNTSPWSPIFHELARTSSLRDSRRGYGLQVTWTGAPFVWLPIDHVFVSDEIVIHDRRVGPDIGSDHLPILMDFSVRKSGERGAWSGEHGAWSMEHGAMNDE